MSEAASRLPSLEIRPRTTGEILDDAWRLYFADAPRLLLLHGSFHIPAFSLLLILVCSRFDSFILQISLSCLLALLLPLTGLGSGAVQERLRRLAENQDASFWNCVGAALRCGLEHAASRAVLLLFLPTLPLTFFFWPIGATLPSVLAEQKGLLSHLGRVGQEARFNPSKAAAIVYCRVPLFLMAFVNAHLLILVFVWAAGNLAGFDVALLGFQFALGNPVYVLALALAVWLLLAPFFEASNYLLYLDTRTRQEGLDLLYRVQRAFSAVEPKRVALLLAVTAGWLLGLPTVSQAAPKEGQVVVQQVRADLEQLTQLVKTAAPYREGAAVALRLHELGDQLNNAFPGKEEHFPWYWRTIENFKEKTQGDALLALDELLRRLRLLEAALMPAVSDPAAPRSKEDLKKLLRERHDDPASIDPKTKKQERTEELEPKRPVIRRDGASGGSPAAVSGPSMSLPAGFGNLCWLVFAGVCLAIVVTSAVLFFLKRPRGKRSANVETGHGTAGMAETLERLHQQPIADLLRRADELLRAGRPLEALRAAYLATLSLLHRKHLLRYEATRTNGEYVREVQLAPQAPERLHEPFNELTLFFEGKWYGERACEANEYGSARALVETIQSIVGRA